MSLHNFSPTTVPSYAIWNAAPTPLMRHLGGSHVALMTRKWRRDYPWITSTADRFGYSDMNAPNGSESQQMTEYGILSSTYETGSLQRLDGGSGEARSARAMTLALDATVNWLALGARTGLQLAAE